MKWPTQTEMQNALDELTALPTDCPAEMRQKISFLRQWLNETNKETITNADIWHWLK